MTKYLKDIDKGSILRKRDDCFTLEEYIPVSHSWETVESGGSYEREYFLGQGNCCLFDITEEEALTIDCDI